MTAIVTLTLSPAVDVSTSVPRLEPEHKLRCGPARRDPGGGGINVARMAHRLGAHVLAVYPAGGPTGEELGRLLETEGVATQAIAVAEPTRENFYVLETASGRQFKFILPGPKLTPDAEAACLQALAPQKPDWLIASGGLPEGSPPELYARVVRAGRAAGAKVVVDTHGPALAAALAEGVWLIKPSLRELEELTGGSLPDDARRLKACTKLIRSGRTRYIALSLGEDGAMLVGADGAFRATAPKVRGQSSTGAGDSFLAGLIAALAGGATCEAALRQAVAVGAAAVLGPGTSLSDPKEIAWLTGLVDVQPIGHAVTA